MGCLVSPRASVRLSTELEIEEIFTLNTKSTGSKIALVKILAFPAPVSVQKRLRTEVYL